MQSSIIKEFKPGIYPHLDISEYHKSPGISSSGINLILDCPAKYHHKYILGNIKPNDDFVLGSVVHILLSEPWLFDRKFYVYEKDRLPDKGSPKEQELLALAGGRSIIKTGALQMARDMVKSAEKHSLWKELKNPKIEHSLFWHGGVFDTPLRSRPDMFDETLGIIVDIKTCKSIKKFEWSIDDFGYHRQAAMQIDAIEALTGKTLNFEWFLIEKEAPYLTARVAAHKDDIAQGRREYLEGACKYTECLLYNDWPGYSENIHEIRLPRYARTEE